MGMLIHHTWLEQQKKAKKPKPVVRDEEPVKTNEPEAEPVKKTGGRRKSSK